MADKIVTRAYTEEFGEGWDRIWGKNRELKPSESLDLLDEILKEANEGYESSK